MCAKGLQFFAVLFGLAASGVLRASSIHVYTSGDMQAVNGTDVRLKCTFQTSSKINPNLVTISWTFRPLAGGKEETVFYYHQQPYPPKEGIFKKRVQWDGDIMGSDASIIIREAVFKYNGTYICQVKNPPDVYGAVGQIKLLVVTTAPFSDLVFLVLSVAGGIAAVVFLLVIIVSCRRCKRKHRRRQLDGDEEAPRKQRKDPTACHPSRAVHLHLVETSVEIDSSDGMISEASTKDPSSSEEEDDDDDDDDNDDSD